MLLPAVAAALVLLILAAAGLLIFMERSSSNRIKTSIAPADREESVLEPSDVAGDAGFAASYGEPTVPRVRPSTKALDAEITIGGEHLAQASGLFEEAKKAAAQAEKDGFGFRKAIEDLKSFTDPGNEYSAEALGLIAGLEKASDAAVAKLMASLNEKAAQLANEGNLDAAINVYNTDIGPLAPESQPERERKMLDLELKKKRRTASEPDELPDGEETPP